MPAGPPSPSSAAGGHHGDDAAARASAPARTPPTVSGRRGRPSSASGTGQLDHEAGAGLAVGAVLDPDPPAVQAHVLGDQRQAEADALAVGAAVGRPAPREKRSKMRSRSSSGTPGPSSSTAIWMPVVDARRSDHAGGAAAVLLGVVEQVGDHPHEAALVGADDDARQLGVELDRHVDARSSGHGLDHQLGRAAPPRGRGGRRRRRSGRSRAGPRPAAGSGRRRRPSGRARPGPRVGHLVALSSPAPRPTPTGSSAGSAARG